MTLTFFFWLLWFLWAGTLLFFPGIWTTIMLIALIGILGWKAGFGKPIQG